MEFSHIPVLLQPCLDGLNIDPAGIYLDGTAGGAGHSREIAKRLTTGRLISLDQDPDAVVEVDFVVNQGNQRYYIQVAYDMISEEKQTQEFNSLRNIPDSFKKIVIVNGSKKPWRNDEGFVIMGMKYFLLNANSLEF